ncbi:PD-(D/E)XK nuclease family protein [Nanoarchaeota archaeon]
MGIRHTSFKHGWFYHYRVHEPKVEMLCEDEFCRLKGFMEKMHEACPDHYFTTGPRSSALKFDVDVKPMEVEGHEVCKLAEIGVSCGRYKTAHSNVEVYMLENDSATIGVEVPIWIMPYELDGFRAMFESEEPLTGHIDILRVEDGKIWIWDYKPNAHREKFAHCQTLFYALMLSRRTGISLDNFRCGYFDEKLAFVFKPEIEQAVLMQEIIT